MKDEHISTDEDVGDGFDDISDDNISADDIDDKDIKAKEKLQKFIKKISRPS